MNAVATERRRLNTQLICAMGDRRALNKTRGPLGHGVIVHENKEEKMAILDQRIADIRAALAAL